MEININLILNLKKSIIMAILLNLAMSFVILLVSGIIDEYIIILYIIMNISVGIFTVIGVILGIKDYKTIE